MDRYLVQFREETQDYFKTDCGFRDGQFYLATFYVLIVVDGLDYVEEGQVLDAETRTCVHRYTRVRTPDAIREEQIAAVFGEPEESVDVNGSNGIDDDPFVRYEGPDDPEITYR